MFAYCLQCQTHRCKVIADLLMKRGVSQAFAPQIISRQRKLGKMIERTYDMLPGYVFVFTEKQLETFELFSDLDGLIQCLGTEDYGTAGLQNADYGFAMNLYQRNGIIGAISLVKAGDCVCIRDPLFDSTTGTILAIDYRKQRAKILFRFHNQDWRVWVACDVVYQDGHNNISG